MSFWILLSSCLVLSSLETAWSRNGDEYRDKSAEYFLRRAARNGLQFQRGMTKIDNRRDTGLRGEDENGDEDYLKRNIRTDPSYYYRVNKFLPEYAFDKDKENKQRELDWNELRKLEDEFLARTRELEKKNYERPKRYEDDQVWKDLDEMDLKKREDNMDEEERLNKVAKGEEKREFLNEKADYDLNGNFFADEKRDDILLDANYLGHEKRDGVKGDNSDFSEREEGADGYEKRKRETAEEKRDDFNDRKRENIEERKRETVEDIADKFELAKREELAEKKEEHLSKKRDGVEEVAEKVEENKRENIDKKEEILTEKSKDMEEKRDHFAEEDKRNMEKEEEKKGTTEEATEERREANTNEHERELDPSADALSLQCESFVEGVELGKGEKECCAKQSTCPVINFMGALGHTCFCDKEFYNCLRAVNTPLSTEIATYYFNEIKSRCFTYDEKQQCQQGSCVTVQTIDAIDPPAF
uniref:Toxin candidate TRINITY_DN21180_c0_g1_i2 n=1 Tax=Isarachnanthus nocturnus TaxID=1240238 RepID=A0A7G7WZ15_9CNID|nr:toxin candidate TRINITY_DN21180_c0_g1_i2 [Isarachnanthus nocturnus]